jgi:hypothetical protein
MREREHEAEWIAVDGSSHERLRLGWESGGWTADGVISGLEVQYAVRLDEHWRARQFLLFRDLEDPDLWLASDGAGRWGEMNGAHRPDLDGCRDLHMSCTPFTTTVLVRRLKLHVGHGADLKVAVIDPETLDVQPQRHRYSRIGERQWQLEVMEADRSIIDFEVDEHGLVLDMPGRFQRVV